MLPSAVTENMFVFISLQRNTNKPMKRLNLLKTIAYDGPIRNILQELILSIQIMAAGLPSICFLIYDLTKLNQVF